MQLGHGVEEVGDEACAAAHGLRRKVRRRNAGRVLRKRTEIGRTRFDIPMPDREHDPALVEFGKRIQYTSNFWRASDDAHADGGVSIYEPVFLGGEILRPVHFLERSEAFWRRTDM
jgi:hypothetical protein